MSDRVLKLPLYIERVISRLENGGYEAYAVGGCVRDMLLGREPADYDICTSALPGEIISCFEGERMIPTGLKHGTLTLIDEQPVEITTFRTDGDYTDGRHPDSVLFIRDLEGDLSRRDFTVNAMAYSPGRGLVDLYGGEADLGAKLIRAVGDPEKRFSEDALRILRALRFASVYGFEIENGTANAAHKLKNRLELVSVERIYSELTKLICGKRAADILRRFPDIIAVFIPEIIPAIGFDQRSVHHDRDVWEHILAVLDASSPDPVMRYASLFHDLGKPACFVIDKNGAGHFPGHPEQGAKIARRILTRLHSDNRTIEQVCSLIEVHDNYFYGGRREMRKYISKLGKERAALVLRFRVCDNAGQSPATLEEKNESLRVAKELYDAVIREGDPVSIRDLDVNGSDIKDSGAAEGQAIGKALEFLLDAVMDEKCENKKDDLIKYLKGNFKG